MNIYQLQIEVAPTNKNLRFGEFEGAFVSVFLASSNLEDSILKMKSLIPDDNYDLLDIEFVRKIDLEDYESEKDENDPDLKELENALSDNNLYYYGSFYTYASEYEH